jgi:hypothetical protein
MKPRIEQAWDAFAKWIDRVERAKIIEKEYPLSACGGDRWRWNTRPALLPPKISLEELAKPCPNPVVCVLSIKDGSVFCEVHEHSLITNNDWENVSDEIPMHHALYVAFSNGREGEILIDEEQ